MHWDPMYEATGANDMAIKRSLFETRPQASKRLRLAHSPCPKISDARRSCRGYMQAHQRPRRFCWRTLRSGTNLDLLANRREYFSA